MSKFYIYRIKVERDPTPSLFSQAYALSMDLIARAIEERPRLPSKKGTEWLIGNIEKPRSDQIFFAFGKLTKSVSEKYDNETKNFTEVTEELAPYTYIAINLATQVCAIGHKSKISQTIKPIANKLVEVLNSTNASLVNEVSFILAEISDPEPFLKAIQDAVIIKKFDMTFSLPNPWDVEKDLHGPQERLLQYLKGKKGKTTVDGDNLEKEVLVPTIKSIASTGDAASAVLKLPGELGFTRKKMSKTQIRIIIPELFGATRKTIIDRIFPEIDRTYEKIRGEIGPDVANESELPNRGID